MESLPSMCISDSIERSRCVQNVYHTLENVNLASVTDENLDGNDEQIVRSIGHRNNIQESSSAADDIPDDSVLLELSDISSTRVTRFATENRGLYDLIQKIQVNLTLCNNLSNEVKVILAEKNAISRELDDLNEQLTHLTLEDTKCKRNQKKKGAECAKTGTFRRTYFCRFGIPYFKTKDRFPADKNEDLKEIIVKKEIMVIRMPPVRRILQHDTQALDTSVLNQLKNTRIELLGKQLSQLVKPEDGNVEYEQQKQNLLRAIESTRSTNDVRDTKDWNIKVNFYALSNMNPRFSVEDYERMWKLLGHPSLSRKEFTKDELNELKKLVYDNGDQDWDHIAEMLNTNRSGFVCFNKWVSLAKKGTRKPWTEEEDDLLRKLCGKLDEIKDSANLYHYWRYIRRQFPHRTYTQIHGHWKYKLAPTLKKGRFTEAETEKLERLIHEGKSFGEIASIFQTRSSVQLRSHYNQIVERASSNSGAWTQDEEESLFKLIDKYGSDWVRISKELGTRNRSQCRLKYLQGAWSPYEKEQFQNLIKKYGPDFEKISVEIGTKSLAQCRMKFLRQKESEKESPYNEGRWTRKETRLFRELFEKYSGDFTLISQELKTRNVEQCQEKYERMTQQTSKHPIKKIEVKVLDGAQENRILKIYTDDTKLAPLNRTTRWTGSEKNRFRELYREYGNQFDKISCSLGTKSVKQCRNMFKKLSGETSLTNSDDTRITENSCRTAVKRKKPPPLSATCLSSAETSFLEHQHYEENSQLQIEDPLKENTGDISPVTKKARTRKCTPKKYQISRLLQR